MKQLQHLDFAPRTPGLEIMALLRHGDADTLSVAKRVFPATAEGQRQCDLVLQSLQLMQTVISAEDSLEDICEKLAQLLQSPPDVLASLMDPFVREDAVLRSGTAWPIALVLDVIDVTGVTRRARFQDSVGKTVGYLKLWAGLDDQYLMAWAAV